MATGISSNGRFRSGGFTLLELLVVIALIGIILTFATLTLGGDRRAERLEEAAERFRQLTRLAAEQAVLRGEEWGLALDEAGYRFLYLEDDGWRPVADPTFRPRHWPEGIEARLLLDGQPAALADAADGDADAPSPDILLLSSGELTGFELVLRDAGTEHVARVFGYPDGRLERHAEAT